MTPEQFVTTHYPSAKNVEHKTGFSAIATLAQAAQESSWGQKVIGFNFFGIKASKDTPIAAKQLIITTEYSTSPNLKFSVVLSVVKQPSGKYKYTVKDWFRKYDTAEQSFTDRVNFFISNPRYASAVIVRGDYEKFFDAISKAGYATDPNYAANLKAVAQSVIKRLPK